MGLTGAHTRLSHSLPPSLRAADAGRFVGHIPSGWSMDHTLFGAEIFGGHAYRVRPSGVVGSHSLGFALVDLCVGVTLIGLGPRGFCQPDWLMPTGRSGRLLAGCGKHLHRPLYLYLTRLSP